MIQACYMCNNGLIDDDLNESNDYACYSIGYAPDRERMMLCTGYSKPLRIEYEQFNDTYGKWYTKAIYYPKYCPECGRKIIEYTIGRRGNKYERNIENQ